MQPSINADSRFTLRVDYPDVDTSEGNETFGTYDAIGLEGKLDAIAHMGSLDGLTVNESPLIIEVRRIK